MTHKRVAVIGHIVPTPLSFKPSKAELWGYNYNRVVVDDGAMLDHVTYLKRSRGVARETPFTVWEMNLCGVLTLRSYLENNGVDVLPINYIDEDNEDEAFAAIKAYAPDVVALGTTFILSPAQLQRVSRLVRKHLPDAFIVAGGQHVATTLPFYTDVQKRKYLLASGLDAFVDDSQGEEVLLKLLRADDLERVPNLVLKRKDGTAVITPHEHLDHAIDDTRIDFRGVAPGSLVHMRTARGCAFHCAFCTYPSSAGKLALMEHENAMWSLRKAKEAGVGGVIFTDDTFNVPKPRFRDLVEAMIAEKLELPWYSFLRCQYVDQPLVEKMKESGCQAVFLGIESGSNTILKNMDKEASIQHYENGIRWLKDAGIKTVGSFIVGFPGETKDTVAETGEFIETSGLDFFFLQPFYYLHNAPIVKRAEEFGLSGQGLSWRHATMEWKQAAAAMDELFLKLDRPTCVNQDYNMWELAYLRGKGLGWDEIVDYRRDIKKLTAAQMKKTTDADATAFAKTQEAPEEKPSLRIVGND